MVRVVVVILLLFAAIFETEAAVEEQRLRQPVALALSGNGKLLFVANRRSGSICVVDTATATVASEIDTEGKLADIAIIDDEHLLALDEGNHQLLLLAGANAQWKVVAKLDLPLYPRRLQVDSDSKRCFVASLWSRAITVIDLSEIGRGTQPRLQVVQQIEMPFEPLELCLAKDRNLLLVAGAFRGMLGAIDTDRAALIATKRTRGHNIRGLAIGSDDNHLWLAQQELIPLAHSTRDDVHWGNVISNLLASVPINELFEKSLQDIKFDGTYYLGEPGNAAGDPGAVSVSFDGGVAVLLVGVNEIALGSETDLQRLRRVPVGRGPIDVVASGDGRVFVACQFSDSVSVVDFASARQIGSVSLGLQREMSPQEHGEMLFYDSRLSHDGWMSCHSCHSDGHTSGQLNDNLSDGSFGAPKRVLSLLGAGDTGPWAWNGQVTSLEEQVQNSVSKTMQGAAPDEKAVAALVAYVKSLPPPPPPTITDAAELSRIERGRELFHALNCQRCHTPPTYTSPLAYDIGLHDEAGNNRFNPPSLRGAAHRDVFFHDARATSLADVVIEHKHQLKRELTPIEADALLQFLRSL